MRSSGITFILAVVAGGSASAAVAQTIAAPNGTAPAATMRSDADRGGDALPDVIVTARRRAEDAQNVPGSLSVVGGNWLDQSYSVNTQALATLIPSLNYSSANPRTTAVTIRGLGSSVVAVSQSNDGLEPGVGFYVDQVYHARPATAAFDFADIEQVEELRGPQGTLFGKNTTAGAINITSRAPTFTREGFAELSYGERNFVQARGWASGPITDTIAFRLSGVSTRRDGVLDNVRTGRAANTLGTQAVRGQLLFKPNDQIQSRVIADFTNFQAYCCTQVFLRVGTTQRAAARQFGGPLGLAAQFGYAPPSTNPYDRKIDIDGDLASDTNEGGLSAVTDLNLGFGTVTSVTAWRFWNWDAENDRDYTGLPIQLSQHIPSRQDQYSQELRLASNGDHRLTYVVGLYGFRQRITGRPISIYGPAGARYLIGTSTGAGASAVAVPSNLLDGLRAGRAHRLPHAELRRVRRGEPAHRGPPDADRRPALHARGQGRLLFDLQLRRPGHHRAHAGAGRGAEQRATRRAARPNLRSAQPGGQCHRPRQSGVAGDGRCARLCQRRTRLQVGRHQHVGLAAQQQ